jgi:cyclase
MRVATTAALLAAAGLFCSGQESFAQDLGAHFKKVKDGIYTYTGKPQDSNCTIILTQEGVVLIDSGNEPTDSQVVMKAVKQLTSLPVRVLIDTEPHADHTTGHFVFSPPAIVVAAAGATDSMKAAYNPQRMARLMESSPEMKVAAQGYRLVTPQVEFKDKMTLNVGERTFELSYLKNVHSEADTSIWMPNEKIVFTAASMGVNRVNNLRPFVTVTDTLNALKMMRAHNPEIVIPGHGEITTVASLDTMEKYYNTLIERMRPLVAQGKSLEDIKKEFKIPAEYAKWDGQDRFDTNIEVVYRHLKG